MNQFGKNKLTSALISVGHTIGVTVLCVGAPSGPVDFDFFPNLDHVALKNKIRENRNINLNHSMPQLLNDKTGEGDARLLKVHSFLPTVINSDNSAHSQDLKALSLKPTDYFLQAIESAKIQSHIIEHSRVSHSNENRDREDFNRVYESTPQIEFTDSSVELFIFIALLFFLCAGLSCHKFECPRHLLNIVFRTITQLFNYFNEIFYKITYSIFNSFRAAVHCRDCENPSLVWSLPLLCVHQSQHRGATPYFS